MVVPTSIIHVWMGHLFGDINSQTRQGGLDDLLGFLAIKTVCFPSQPTRVVSEFPVNKRLYFYCLSFWQPKTSQ